MGSQIAENAALGRSLETEKVLRVLNEFPEGNGNGEHAWVEERIREQFNFVLKVIESLDHPFSVIDAKTHEVRLRNSAAQRYGKANAKRCFELSHLRDSPCCGAEHPCPLEMIKRTKESCVVEHTHYNSQGQRYFVEVHAHPILDEHGEVREIIEYSIDITERKLAEERQKRLEERLRRAQKLESLGLMAGGFAHEFNNILVGILGNADLAMLQLAKDSPVRQTIDALRRASAKASELTRQVLAYCGGGGQKLEVQLNELACEAEDFARQTAPSNITLEFDLASDLPTINADADQVYKVMTGIITNAFEAIGESPGFVKVKTEKWDFQNSEIGRLQESELETGDYVCFEVSNNGPGIPEEVMGKIFEPFFSTKFTGRGLGLSAAIGIARRHGGTIEIDSSPTGITTFRVLLAVNEA